jgi:AraC-like DNA-binding protein
MPAHNCIIPAKFVQLNSRAARVWAVVRGIDHPDNRGTGCGKVRIDIGDLAAILNRSIRSAYRYIKAGLSAKFLHSCQNSNGELTIHYASLTRIAKQLELDGIGAIAEFPLEDIHNAKVRAAEAAAVYLQRASYWQMKRQHKKAAEGAKHADELLKCRSSERLPGSAVLQRGKRVVYLAEWWKPFGVSERGIATHLGCSERTVQRRFSDDWRESRGILPLNKAQAAHLVAEGLSPSSRRLMVKHAPEHIQPRLVTYGKKVFYVRTNLYDPDTCIRNQGWRKAEYRENPPDKEDLCAENRSPAGASALDSLMNLHESKNSGVPENRQEPERGATL